MAKRPYRERFTFGYLDLRASVLVMMTLRIGVSADGLQHCLLWEIHSENIEA